eukprot:gb/GECH01009190.1/.p1 GENE.gb/GECH01009190.1/~~gb/GECH01009190.1/.p1  ORF type:complete len:267 (+),score=92.73 gb/GECH01009190.1/:1-801(+)
MSDIKSKKFGKAYSSVDATNIIDSKSRKLRNVEFTDYGKLVGRRDTSSRGKTTKTRKYNGEKTIDNNISKYQRPEEEQQDEDKENVKNITSTMNTMSIRKNPRYKQNKDSDDNDDETAEKSAKKEENNNATTRLRKRKDSNQLLSDEVLSQIRRLLGRSAKPKKSASNALEAFLSLNWNGKAFDCEELGITGLEFGELNFQEANDWKWMKKHKNAFVIADSEEHGFIATNSRKSSDFKVVFCSNENTEEHQGPYKLSDFLKMLKRA